MSNKSKLKITIPVLYMASTFLFFLLAWPNELRVYHVMGSLISIVSFFLWIISRMQLGDSFTIAPEAQKLVDHGMYSRFRHPVYYFSITSVLGIILFAWNAILLIPFVGLTILQIYRIRVEERLLAASFGDEYGLYKSKTWL